MKKVLVFVFMGLCLFFFVGCENKITSDQEGEHQFTINGILVKDMNLGYDIAQFIVYKDTLGYDSAIVVVDNDTIPHIGNGIYLSYLYDLEAGSTQVTISCPDDSFELTKDIIMPNTFHITDITGPGMSPDRINAGGQTATIEWTGSQYASGYFVVVYHRSAIGHNELVDYNFTSETVVPTAFKNLQDGLVDSTFWVYVVSYRESFLPYLDIPFDLPDGLPQGNLDGADGTIGAGVIAPRDSIKVIS